MRDLKDLLALTRARLIVFVREPEAIFWVFVFPLVLAAVLGWAFRSGGSPPSRVAVAPGPGAEALAERLAADGSLELARGEPREELERRLARGALDLVVLPAEDGAWSVRLDPARSEAELARLRVLRALDPERSPDPAVDQVTERGSRYVDFLFPGLVGMNVMGTSVWLIGFAVADLRQRKLLKRLLVTPMRRSTFIASLLSARLVFLVLEVLVLVLFGSLALGVPFRSNPLVYLGLCLTAAVAFAGIGGAATARVKTIQGASGVINLVLMPMWLGSGVFFSYERFPEALHPVLRALPLTALNDALRALQLEGRGLAAVLPELGVLLAWGMVSFAVALKTFRWE
jgi:ABC-type multidrug transport system permease subunit